MRSSFALILIILFWSCNKTGKVNYRTLNDNETIGDDNQSSNNTTNGSGYGSGSGSGSPNGPSDLGDPLEIFQWHLKNNGQASFSSNGGTYGEDVGLNLDSNVVGTGVLVAVSDNGVQIGHEDLTYNALEGTHKNYSLSSPYYGDPSPVDDEDAHGTAVAGIILATAGNGVGGRGVAPGASLAGLKFLTASITTAKFIDQANGIYDVFNYSYGGYSCSFSSAPSSYLSQLEYATSSLRGGKGAVFVKAAGNEYYAPLEDCYEDIEGSPYYLGNAALEEDQSYPYYILVAALDANGSATFYSSPGSSLWVAAPGGDFGVTYPAIVTTDIEGCSKGYSNSSATENEFESGELLNTNCNYTSTMNGTSSSAPMVSGVVALMLAVNPNLTWRDIKYILASTARQVDSSSVDMNHPTGNTLTGHTYMYGWRTNAAGFKFHNWYGFGAVDADAAIAMSHGFSSSWGSLTTSSAASGNLNKSIPDESSTGVSDTIYLSANKTIEAVQISVNIDHSYIGDIGIELISPSGSKSQLMLINSGLIQENINNSVLLTNAFFMESSQGNWTIKVVDGAAEDTGTLKNWSVKIFGH